MTFLVICFSHKQLGTRRRLMTCIEKFTFSRRFAAGAELIRHRDEPGALVVLHSDEEIARIRAEALAEGRAEGHAAGVAAGRAQAEAEAAAALARQEAKVLERLAERLAEAVAGRDEIAKTAERGALTFVPQPPCARPCPPSTAASAGPRSRRCSPTSPAAWRSLRR